MTAMPADVPAAAWPVPEVDSARPHDDDIDVTLDPTHDEVARAAYALYEARGFEDGHAEEDWFAAEQQVRAMANGDRH